MHKPKETQSAVELCVGNTCGKQCWKLERSSYKGNEAQWIEQHLNSLSKRKQSDSFDCIGKKTLIVSSLYVSYKKRMQYWRSFVNCKNAGEIDEECSGQQMPLRTQQAKGKLLTYFSFCFLFLPVNEKSVNLGKSMKRDSHQSYLKSRTKVPEEICSHTKMGDTHTYAYKSKHKNTFITQRRGG